MLQTYVTDILFKYIHKKTIVQSYFTFELKKKEEYN